MIGEWAHGSGTLVNLTGDKDNAMDSWSDESGTHAGCRYGAGNGTGDRQGMAAEANDNNVSPLNSDEASSWRTRYGC